MKKSGANSAFAAAALALTATATLGACAGAASPGTAQADAATNLVSAGHACATGQVAVSATDPEAGVGHRSLTILLTNTGSAACVLQGYPGAAVTDTTGAVILAAERTLRGYMGGAAGVVKVNLPAHGQASAILEWLAFSPHGAHSAAPNCPGLDGGRLLITPPDSTRTTSVALPTDICQELLIHPVVSGASGRS